MEEIPSERYDTAPSFIYYGLDIFGPFLRKEGMKEVKRYGITLTCLNSRAVHIDSANGIEVDTFILELRQFIAWCGDVQLIRSDNGINFLGKSFMEMVKQKIKFFNLKNEWLKWKKNPLASHMRKVSEMQIRSTRSILTSLMKTHCLSDCNRTQTHNHLMVEFSFMN